MAERPVFLPSAAGAVEERSYALPWASGFAPVQKRKNVASLHRAAARDGLAPLLEVSTKSDLELGRRLSAFNLKATVRGDDVPLECAFQGSKVFAGGGPFVDLYHADPRTAKRDPRLLGSGDLIGFSFSGEAFPLSPKTVFYDWLYIRALRRDRDAVRRDLAPYRGFTDIEFNPKRSINCQARSCALFVSLMDGDIFDDLLGSPGAFVASMRGVTG